MKQFHGPGLLACTTLVLALIGTSCGGGNGVSPTTAASQVAPSASLGLPPELADAIEQDDGTYRTPDGRIFAAPERFATQDCEDVRWPVPHDTVDRAHKAGVAVDSVEWLTHHVHAYLGVFVDGDPVVVPAGIGIDNDKHLIAGLHTHDCSGTVHVEVDKEADLTLGQVADAWGVRLDKDCLEGLCGGEHRVVVRLDGLPVANPRGVAISDCAEILIVVGVPPDDFPDTRAEGC